MKRFFLILIVCLLAVQLFAINQNDSVSDKFAYAYGALLYSSMVSNYPDLNFDVFLEGAAEASKGKSAFSQEEIKEAFSSYQQYLYEQQNQVATANLEQAENFLKQNKKISGVITTDSGLQYKILKQGTGKTPEQTDSVTINYEIISMDGKIVDSSYERNEPSIKNLEDLVPGFKEGICLMKEGSKYRFWVEPSLGYGEEGTQTVSPNSLLIFNVELISVND
ncbi:MAG: FKBP-type peptidyl-prolyl cis-trans isomerase N-terminal domain-containing protein [Sphaerochaetaceae bacterium]|nr:FKBP-type peptidyl-prolyl cis-trans isomerase N-terminal domain-containing protein [Sphaerochaetaceae bacterium]